MKTLLELCMLPAALLGIAQLAAQTPGSLDTSFQAELPADFVIPFFGPLAVQPDGKIIVGGTDNLQAGPGSEFLARLKSDGGFDQGFNPVGITGVQGADACGSDFKSIVAQTDGKIVLGGYGWQVPALHQTGLVRLNADGSVDPSFASQPGWDVRRLFVLTDGAVLVSSFFGVEGFPLVRLRPSGEVDSSFAPTLQVGNGNIYDFVVQPDGRIVLSIPETLIAGDKRNVVRLLPDRSYDSTFQPVLTEGDARLEPLPDGKILILGIGAVNGIARLGLARLDVDGRLDLNFVPFTDDLDTENVAIQRDGKLILPQMWLANGYPTRELVRLNPDGSWDETYVSAIQHDLRLPDDNFHVRALVLQPDENLLVSTLDSGQDGGWIGSIIRLHGDGLPFIVPTSVHRNAHGALEFQITAATNRNVVVEATTGLTPVSWTPLTSFAPATYAGRITFTDPDAAKFPQRFYRAVRGP